jgi:preprotein translocase subunit SecE
MTMEQRPEPTSAETVMTPAPNFLNEVITELKKTTWPTRQEALRLTYVVIAVIIVLGVYMAILDTAFGTLFTRILHR